MTTQSSKLDRLLALVEAGHPRDDLLAGFCYAQPAVQLEIGEDLRRLADSGDRESALELCAQLLNHVEAPYARYYMLAYAAMWADQLGLTDRGIDYAKEALSVVEAESQKWAVEGRAWCCNQIAWPLLVRGEFAEARDWARRGLKHGPKYGNLHSTLGSALFELGDEAAFASLESAMKLGVTPVHAPLRDSERYRELARTHGVPLPKVTEND